MAPDTYIHGTEPSEQDRLAALNRMTNAAFIRFLDVPSAARVLEVGSGLGLLASSRICRVTRDQSGSLGALTTQTAAKRIPTVSRDADACLRRSRSYRS